MIKRDYAELADKGARLTGSLTSVLRGTVSGCIFLVIAFAVLAVVYTYTPFPAGLIGPFTSALTALSLLVCGFVSVFGVSGLGWLHGAASGAVHSVLRIIIAALASKAFSPATAVLSVLALGVLLGAVGGIIGINLKR